MPCVSGSSSGCGCCAPSSRRFARMSRGPRDRHRSRTCRPFHLGPPLWNSKALHVPPGFEIQLVASEPAIHKPLNLAFDDRGRLWVTDTLEYPYPARQGTIPRDSVKILSNFQANGRAGKVETFADGLNIPIGLLPLPNGRDGAGPQHPQHLLDARYRRRRASRRARGALRGLRQPRHTRDDQRLHLGIRRLDLRLPRLHQRLRGAGEPTIGRSA